MTCDLRFVPAPCTLYFFYKNHIYKKVRAEIGAKLKNILRTYPYRAGDAIGAGQATHPRNFEILDLFSSFFSVFFSKFGAPLPMYSFPPLKLVSPAMPQTRIRHKRKNIF